MVNLEYILFLCVVAPLFLMLLMLPGRARLVMGYMIIGIIVCLFASELNALLLPLAGSDLDYATSVITPLTEEIVKAIPILVYALVYSNKRETVTMIAFALGIGFGMFENTVILVQNIASVTLSWALIRGFATALMHGMCTYCVGFGISFIRKRRKLFYTGIFALLTFAAIYHGIFNLLQINHRYIGSFLPIVTYFPFLLMRLQFHPGLLRFGEQAGKSEP